MTFGLRQMRPEERPFVAGNWRRYVLRRASRMPERGHGSRIREGQRYVHGGHGVWFDPEVWAPLYASTIDALLDTATAIVAFDNREPDEPVGFAVASSETLHFVFVLEAGRRRGIGTALLGAVTHGRDLKVSHLTKAGEALLGARKERHVA